jgi:hypothetical protein
MTWVGLDVHAQSQEHGAQKIEQQTPLRRAVGESTVSGSLSIPLGFAGGLEDQVTGLVRSGARDYDPQDGPPSKGLGLEFATSPIPFITAVEYTFDAPSWFPQHQSGSAMTASISTCAPLGSAATPKATRAGGSAGKKSP